ncbi:MAG TPA: hypothetical protein PKA77_14190 [Chitinophagaceae bacterium]|jgi:hypothetical protein|nr:hypothetical protein [Chitinophagaceae bacterium]HMU58640.1 hypothetical protein [Chitinophagaceae bacterium]
MIKKVLTATIVGGGLFAGYAYYKRLKKMQVELEIIPKAALQKLSTDGLTIRVDVLMKNPTKGSFKIKFPFVKLIYSGSTIGSSQVVNQEITIPAYGEVNIDQILITLPIVNIFSLGYSVVKTMQKKEPVQLQLKVMTIINLGFKEFPYETTSDIVLKK